MVSAYIELCAVYKLETILRHSSPWSIFDYVLGGGNFLSLKRFMEEVKMFKFEDVND